MKGSASAPEDCNPILEVEAAEAWQIPFFDLLELLLTSQPSPAWQTIGGSEEPLKQRYESRDL